jgi:hypothetical protein
VEKPLLGEKIKQQKKQIKEASRKKKDGNAQPMDFLDRLVSFKQRDVHVDQHEVDFHPNQPSWLVPFQE